jgi:hypothetical protein
VAKKLYKSSAVSDVRNSRRSGEIAVPYQPVKAGAKVVGAKKGRTQPKGGTFKLKIRKTK